MAFDAEVMIELSVKVELEEDDKLERDELEDSQDKALNVAEEIPY